MLENVDKQTVSVPIDFHSVFCSYNVSQWELKLFGLAQKKVIHTGLEQH